MEDWVLVNEDQLNDDDQLKEEEKKSGVIEKKLQIISSNEEVEDIPDWFPQSRKKKKKSGRKPEGKKNESSNEGLPKKEKEKEKRKTFSFFSKLGKSLSAGVGKTVKKLGALGKSVGKRLFDGVGVGDIMGTSKKKKTVGVGILPPKPKPKHKPKPKPKPKRDRKFVTISIPRRFRKRKLPTSPTEKEKKEILRFEELQGLRSPGFQSFDVYKIVLLEFDMEIGSRIVCSFPESDEMSKRMKKRITQCSLPDGSHSTNDDFGIYFVSGDGKDEFFYVLNYFLRKRDESVDRKYTIKALSICSRSPRMIGCLNEVLDFSLSSVLVNLDFGNKVQKETILKFLKQLYLSLNMKGRSCEDLLRSEKFVRRYCLKFEREESLEDVTINQSENDNEGIVKIDFISPKKEDLKEIVKKSDEVSDEFCTVDLKLELPEGIVEVEKEGSVEITLRNEGSEKEYLIGEFEEYKIEKKRKVITEKTFSIKVPLNSFECEIVDPRISLLNLVKIFQTDLCYLYYSILFGKKTLFLSSTISDRKSLWKNSDSQKNLSLKKMKTYHGNSYINVYSAGDMNCIVMSVALMFPEEIAVDLIKNRMNPYITIDCDFKGLHSSPVCGSVNPIFESKNLQYWDSVGFIENGVVKLRKSFMDDIEDKKKNIMTKSEKKFFKKIVELVKRLKKKKLMTDPEIERVLRFHFENFTRDVLERFRREEKKLKMFNITKKEENGEDVFQEEEVEYFLLDYIYSYKTWLDFPKKTVFSDLNRIEYDIRRLKSLSEKETELIKILQNIRREFLSDYHILEFLSYFPMNLSSEFNQNSFCLNGGGLYPIAVYVFHENEVIRCLVCWILQRISKLKVGKVFVDSLGLWLKHCYLRNLTKFNLTDSKEEK